jgi:hypothetical protein
LTYGYCHPKKENKKKEKKEHCSPDTVQNLMYILLLWINKSHTAFHMGKT